MNNAKRSALTPVQQRELVRLLSHTVNSPLLSEALIDEALILTEVVHLFAAAQIVAQIDGNDLVLPKFDSIIDQLRVILTINPTTSPPAADTITPYIQLYHPYCTVNTLEIV